MPDIMSQAGSCEDCYTGSHMIRVFVIFLAVSFCVSGGDVKKRKKEKLPDIEVLAARARRVEDTIRIDGRVRNAGDKLIQGLVLQFDFMDSDHNLLTSQKSGVEDESLDPGKEAGFHVELNAPPRSIEFQISAVDETDRELRVIKGGPFVIE